MFTLLLRRSRTLFIVSELIISTALLHGDTLEISPKIVHVTVFTNNAMVEKEGKVSLKKGTHTINIPGLTPNLISNSLQIKMEGGRSVKISDIKVEQTYLQKSEHEKVDKLQSQLEQTTDLIKIKNDEITIITSSNDFLKKTTPFSQNQKVSPSELEAHIAFLEKSLAENYNRITKIEIYLKELQKEKVLIEKELSALKTSDQSKNVQITLSSSADLKDQKIEVSYMVNYVHWTPLYIIDADSVSGKVEWSDFVSISQASGEDWTDASIEISTAKPFSASAPDPLEGWYIDIYRPLPQTYAKSAYNQLETMERRSSVASMAPESYTEPTVQQESASFSFILPGKNTIPSDNQPHKVFIASSVKEAKFYYRAVPRLSPYAYLTAVLDNPFSFPLLAGEMTLLLDGRVVGIRNTLKTLFPEEETLLSLGANESIKIEYKQKKKYAKTASKETHVQYSYAHEITNGKNKPIQLSVEDHFPVSRHEQIKVILNTPQKETAKISEEGIITWDVELNAHEKKVMPMQFTVTYPKKIEVEGLE